METNLEQPKNIDAAIEAILFAAGHPMTYEKIAEVISLTPGKVKKHADAYAKKLNAEERGIMMLVFEDCCQLCTREEYLAYIKEALGIRKGGNLSASSIETLAIIAYNRQTTRAYVDLVRGVDSSYAFASLLEKNLIEVCGRLDVPGRPNIYRTTSTFLRCFGIDSLDQLPYVDLPHPPMEAEIIPIDVDGENGEPEKAELPEGETVPAETAEPETPAATDGEFPEYETVTVEEAIERAETEDENA